MVCCWDVLQQKLTRGSRRSGKVKQIKHSPAPAATVTIKEPPFKGGENKNRRVSFGGMSYDPRGENFWVAQNVVEGKLAYSRLVPVPLPPPLQSRNGARQPSAPPIWRLTNHVVSGS